MTLEVGRVMEGVADRANGYSTSAVARQRPSCAGCAESLQYRGEQGRSPGLCLSIRLSFLAELGPTAVCVVDPEVILKQFNSKPVFFLMSLYTFFIFF